MPLYPSLYEIHTRAWLGELSRTLGRPITLENVPEVEIDRLAGLGFDWIWLLGVWQTGPEGRTFSRTNPQLCEAYRRILPDFAEADVCGSPFAVRDYSVHADFGGTAALAQLRQRFAAKGLKLMLDLVPNHTAPDHAWVSTHPEYYVRGLETSLAAEPRNFRRFETSGGPLVLAHGRDPYFPGWVDTLQLNYRHRGFREAMIGEMDRIASLCDGVRCDMAMLLLPDVFSRTWGDLSKPADGTPPVDASFWAEAIPRVRARHPGFIFMAEAYWDLEWALQQQGFDYTYDKRLYDRLLTRDASAVRSHLWADMDFQRRSVRFLENHDEPRAAEDFPHGVHQAAAMITFLVPGLRFFHEGQLVGRKVHLSVHLGRRPEEPIDETLRAFYARLLDVLKRPELRDGRWRLLDCRPGWEGNPSHERFLAFSWEGEAGKRLLVAVNFSPSWGQSYVSLPFDDLRGRTFVLRDLMGSAQYERAGDDLAARGLYLDMPEWGYHLFDVEAR